MLGEEFDYASMHNWGGLSHLKQFYTFWDQCRD